MKKEPDFERRVREAWNSLKLSVQQQHQAKLRNTLLKVIAEEDIHFAEFVELMQASGWDEKAAAINWFDGKKIVLKTRKNRERVNKELDKAASTDVAIITCKGCGQFTEATNAKNFSDGVFCDKCIDANNAGPLTHQCHYCGDMYAIADLTGAKEGLICYKCRHEMENRD
jgi:hypothetical protein